MPQPDLFFFHNCAETFDAPVPGTDDFELQGNQISPYRPFSEQAAEGNAFPYSATDGVQWEHAVGIYHDGPPITIERPDGSDPDLIYYTTNNNQPVNWGAGATIQIFSGLVGPFAQKIFGVVQSPGILCRIGEHDYAPREMKSTAEFLSWLNPKGIGGDPTAQAVYLPLRRDGGTLTERSMVGALNQENPLGRFSSLDADAATFSELDNDTVEFLRRTRVFADTYRMELLFSGALHQLIHTGTGLRVSDGVTTFPGTGPSVTLAAPGALSVIRRLEIMFSGVNLSAGDDLLVQIGDAGGIETTGYVSSSSLAIGATPGSSSSTSGYVIRVQGSGRVVNGIISLAKFYDNLDEWICAHNCGVTGSNTGAVNGGGTKQLSDPLTQVRIATTGASDIVAGSGFRVRWWGT